MAMMINMKVMGIQGHGASQLVLLVCGNQKNWLHIGATDDYDCVITLVTKQYLIAYDKKWYEYWSIISFPF